MAGPGGARRRRRVARQEPQHDHQREDDGADAAQEDLGALPQPDQQVAQVRPVVLGQLQQQRVVASLCSAVRFSTQATGHRRRRCRRRTARTAPALQVERADGPRRDEGADQQRVHRQPRRAGHQRRDHDGRQPVAQVRDGARRHDAGHGAGEARQQRDERAARQADAAHQAVEQEGGARQVARCPRAAG